MLNQYSHRKMKIEDILSGPASAVKYWIDTDKIEMWWSNKTEESFIPVRRIML